MALSFRELDTVDFFVAQAKARPSRPVNVPSLDTASDHDDVLLDCPIENWDANDRPRSAVVACSSQDSGDSTSKRRARRPPLVRKPKATVIPLPSSSSSNRPTSDQHPSSSGSSFRFSSAFHQYLNDIRGGGGDDERSEPSPDVTSLPSPSFLSTAATAAERSSCSDDDTPSIGVVSSQSLTTVKSVPVAHVVDNEGDLGRRVCTTCRLFFPTPDSLRAHSCSDHRIVNHYPKLSTSKDCGRCGALNRVGYFCSMCGHPLSSRIDSHAASASSSPARSIPVVRRRPSRSSSVGPSAKHEIGAHHLSRAGVLRTPDLSRRKSSIELVQCPHCSRKFSRAAADRHIDICCKVVNRPSPVRTRPLSVPMSSRSRPNHG